MLDLIYFQDVLGFSVDGLVVDWFDRLSIFGIFSKRSKPSDFCTVLSSASGSRWP